MSFILQIQLNKFKIVKIFIVTLLFISPVILLNINKGIPFKFLTSDIAAIAEVPFYTGFFSQIGFIIWIMTATICFLSAYISKIYRGDRELRTFLFLSGLLSTILCLDDMFLLHEQVFPIYLGLSEIIIFILYACLVVFLVIRYYATILKTNYILILVALFSFGSSIALDLVKINGLNSYLTEDGFKMTGIVSWFFYYYDIALLVIQSPAGSRQLKVDKDF